MPTIFPMEPQASWPQDEGVIGVVGVAPWATLDFLTSLYSLVPVSKDWHFPRVISDINTKIPSRGRYLDLGERDPVPYIQETISELAAMGATVVVVPCNTAHILYDRWSQGAHIPVPSIIEAVMADIDHYHLNKIAVLASAAVTKYKIYHQALSASGLSAVELNSSQQHVISKAIENIKVNGKLSTKSMSSVDNLLAELVTSGVDGVILGCTELKSLEARCRHHALHVYESNKSLARIALKMVNINPIVQHYT
jgi:aspartate racemase